MCNLIKRVITGLQSQQGTEKAVAYISGWTHESPKPHFMDSEHELYRMCEELAHSEIKLAIAYLECYFREQLFLIAYTGGHQHDSEVLREIMAQHEFILAAVEDVLYL